MRHGIWKDTISVAQHIILKKSSATQCVVELKRIMADKDKWIRIGKPSTQVIVAGLEKCFFYCDEGMQK